MARRQQKWLYSVETSRLDGTGYAVTLTLKECPETAGDWHRLRTNWEKRIRRIPGFLRLHWVTEWQRRKVPHLHAAVYFKDRLPLHGFEMLGAWLEIVEKRSLTASIRSQDVKTIDGAVGWLQYLSKHASRSVAHYQRMGMPSGWESTGRLWGKLGAWPTLEPIVIDGLGPGEQARFRRLLDAYELAQARSVGDKLRLAYLKRRRKVERDPYLSRIRGGSEWIPEAVSLALVNLVLDER